MKTHLEDSYNNKKIETDKNGTLLLSDLINSIQYRIDKHIQYIKYDEQVIIDNIDYTNIITDAIERINERKAKIGELKEFIQLCL